MDKKDLIREFLDSFKKTLNVSSLYSKGHPLFMKAVKDFKEKLDRTLAFVESIEINIATDSFSFQDMEFSEPQDAELAKKMHMRKIKRIKIRQGITLEELTFFLDRITKPLKDFIKDGGIGRTEKNLEQHLFIEEIDYWELLKSGGGEYHKDIWAYLFNEAIGNNDHDKIIQLSMNFPEILKHFTVHELLEDAELYESFKKFLSYLKDKEKDRFSKCSENIVRYIFNIVNVFSDSDLEKIGLLFGCFAERDLSDILTNEILNVSGEDTFNFDLFLKIVDVKNYPAIAFLTERYHRDQLLGDKQKIRAKVERLLSTVDKYQFSKTYHDMLDPFLKEVSSDRGLVFDRNSAHVNYRIILLNLFFQEKNNDRSELIIRHISRELKNALHVKDFGYFKLLVDILKMKKIETPQMSLLFEDLDKQIAGFVENNIWNEQLPEDFQYMADYVESSVLNADFYLNKIFGEEKIKPIILKLFLKFFPDSLPIFLEKLKRRYSDIGFNEKLIQSLKMVNNSSVPDVLKEIYLVSNEYIKGEVLVSMQELGAFNREFLLSILQKDEIFQKREALLILMKDNEAKQEALKALFLIKSPWGIKNRVLMDNIIVVEELGLKDARDYLVSISKKHFFWNWRIKRKAKEVLKKWTE